MLYILSQSKDLSSPSPSLSTTPISTMLTSNSQTMAQPRSVTLTFTQPDPASFIQGSAAALLLLALPSLLGLAGTATKLPEASTIRHLLGATAMPCGLYAIKTAIIQSDSISEEHERDTRLANDATDTDDVAGGGDDRLRDGSLLSVKSEMRCAAYCKVARRGCFGLALLVGGFAVLMTTP